MPGVVLVVEDDAHALSGYMEFLASEGFEPVGAADGNQALGLALERPPAAVVTDISLPGLNGLALASALRHDERTRGVPILALTAHWSADITSRAAEAGIIAVLLKPCLPSHLVAELRRVLAGLEEEEHGSRGRATAEEPG